MPTLRSQTAAASALKKSSGVSEQGDAMMEAATAVSNPSSPCLGPSTPAQDSEAARAGVPRIGSVIRRSRRLCAGVSVATADINGVEDSMDVPKWRVNRRRARGEEGTSLPVDKEKRKAKDSIEEAFSEFPRGKDYFIGAKSEESSPGDFLGAAKPGSALVTNAGDQDSLPPPTKSKVRSRGRRRSQFLEPMLGDGISGHQSNGPLSFDLNERLLESISSDEVPDQAPYSESFLEAGKGPVHLDIDCTAEDGDDVAMLAVKQTEETVSYQVIDDSDDHASDPASEVEAGPSHRPASKQRHGVRSRRGQAEASRSRFLQIARDRAFHFAHFNADGDEAPAGAPPEVSNGRRRRRQPHSISHSRPQPPPVAQQVDWPGPFSTARQLVNNRAEAAAARQHAGPPGSKVSLVDWHSTRAAGDPAFYARKCPSLQDLCLSVLSSNAENVVSLEGVPELLRLRISNAFCERRMMSAKVLSLFFEGEPSEIHSLDCTQILEDELTELLKQVSPSRLEKLHLDNCGRALSERCLLSTIASPSSVTLLKFVSFRGAYRLSDAGLEALLQASPQLVQLDLSTCSFLTDASIKAIACCTGETLESLVLDGCMNLNAAVFLHDLVRLQKLRKISLADVGGVTDEVVSEICVQLGSHLRELVLAGCKALTDVAVAAIGPCCPSLQVLDLAYLPLLTDLAVAHITDNLRIIQVLNVRRCNFSDEAIAAFLTASGAALHNLSLNSVHQVADQTILALARHSHAFLERLDLSFCRLVDDECLGFLADSCLQLQELKLYGCTQVTNKFLNGHNNPNLKVVGLTRSVSAFQH